MKAGLPALAPAFALVLAPSLAACAPAAKAPPVAVAPAPRPAPAPGPRPSGPLPSAALPTVPGSRWMDMPRSPGEWRYGAQSGRSEAAFRSPAGTPLARLACLADSRTIVLSLPDGGVPSPLVTVRTETASRSFAARAGDRDLSVALAPGDPLLDAMAMSKGTFALEADGLAPLYLPSWAEVSRVIEDCRG